MSLPRCFQALALISVAGLGACAGRAYQGPPPVTVGSLAGIIRTADTGSPVGDATIVLRRPGELAPVQERTNGTGAYMIAALPPGQYDVKVYQDERTIGDEQIAIQAGKVTGLDLAVGPRLSMAEAASVDVASGTPLWRFRPADANPGAAVIEGTVTELGERTRLEGAVVTVVDRDGRLIAEAVSDDGGRYHIEDVAPGSYAVSAYYTLVGRGQFEIRRNDVVITAGEVVVVPLAIETDGP